MSVMQLANSLMLDFRTVIDPRFVYANYPDFDDESVSSPEILKRIDELTQALVKLTSSVASFE
ncbi:MAG: hypothetical protein D8M59_10200 [Planctomycetes bacterium]|nr:hypothetical protein [Planctomycetota bacterium]NOG55214.1 hypothetical protein [Planctomycetota bacterium]